MCDLIENAKARPTVKDMQKPRGSLTHLDAMDSAAVQPAFALNDGKAQPHLLCRATWTTLIRSI